MAVGGELNRPLLGLKSHSSIKKGKGTVGRGQQIKGGGEGSIMMPRFWRWKARGVSHYFRRREVLRASGAGMGEQITREGNSEPFVPVLCW